MVEIDRGGEPLVLIPCNLSTPERIVVKKVVTRSLAVRVGKKFGSRKMFLVEEGFTRVLMSDYNSRNAVSVVCRGWRTGTTRGSRLP